MQQTSSQAIKYVLAAALALLLVGGGMWAYTGEPPWQAVTRSVDAARTQDFTQSLDYDEAELLGDVGLLNPEDDEAIADAGDPISDTVPFGDTTITKPVTMSAAESVEAATVATEFTDGLWDRKPDDNSQYSSFIRMWDKYGCPSVKAEVIEGFKELPAAEGDAWAKESAETTVVTVAPLLRYPEDEEGVTTDSAYVELLLPIALYHNDNFDEPINKDWVSDEYRILNENGETCVLGMTGFSWEWAEQQTANAGGGE